MRQPHSGVRRCVARPRAECVRRGAATGKAAGSNHGYGSNGQQGNDNYDQEVNITNIDRDARSIAGGMEERVV